jgi:hypothetical protein
MFRTMKWAAAPLLALAVMFSASTKVASAADESAKGTITGTVVGADDKPVANASVRLLKQMDKGERKAEKGAKKSDGAEAKAAAEKPAKGDRPAPVATATTDNDGKFELKDVPAGKYTVMANAKGVGNDRESVEVKAGETATVSLKLERHEGKAGAGEKKNEKHGDAK